MAQRVRPQRPARTPRCRRRRGSAAPPTPSWAAATSRELINWSALYDDPLCARPVVLTGHIEARDAHARTNLLQLPAGAVVEPRCGAGIETPAGTAGPDGEALAFLAHSLEIATEPHRIVLMHAPPHFDGRYAPHPQWGFNVREQAFLELVRRHDVKLVCCAHALLFDHHVHGGTHFVVSGGGGSAICSRLRGVCAPGDGPPEDRGALSHAVEITVAENRSISGRVHQAFEPIDGHARLRFGDGSVRA
jgi:hypothetical protein